MIYYSLMILKKFGFQEIVINLHHLGELIEKELGSGRKFGMKIYYSWEEEILGTGGGIRQAARFFPHEPLLIVNSDVLIDVRLNRLVRFHKKKKGVASMVIRPRDPESGFSAIRVGSSDRILGIEEAARSGESMYTGVQVIEPPLLAYLPPAKASCVIQDGYAPALAAGEPIFAYRYNGYWNDLGTLERYRQADNDLTSGRTRLSFLK